MLGSLFQSIVTNILTGRVVNALNTIFPSLSITRRVYHYVFDTKVQAKLTRVDRYQAEPYSEIDMGIFREISKTSDDATFDAIDNRRNVIRIKGDSLPTPLEVRIEPMPIFENGTHEIKRYEAIIETYTYMTFGYRSSDPLDEFRTLSDDIAKILCERCFNNTRPNNTFLTGEIKGQLPTSEESIEDEEIEMRAEVNGDTIQMTFKDPRNLTRGIQKYFQPL